VTSKIEDIKIIFHLSSLMTSFLENLKPHNRLLTSIKVLRQFNTHLLLPNLIRNSDVNFDF